MMMTRHEGDREPRRISADELCNRVVPMHRAKRMEDTQEFPAMGVEPDHSAQMIGWVLLAVCCAASAASGGFAVWLVMRGGR